MDRTTHIECGRCHTGRGPHHWSCPRNPEDKPAFQPDRGGWAFATKTALCVCAWVLLIIGLFLMGCEGEPQPGDAAKECRQYQETICRNQHSCNLVDYRECLGVIKRAMPPCETAKIASDDFPDCISNLNDMGCNEYEAGNVPFTCRNALDWR